MAKEKPNRAQWVSLIPYGLNRVKPNHYLEIFKTIWRNRDELPYAWRILTQGVCDGCALGTTGIHDFTMDGIHLCTVRLDLLRLNTMPALDIRQLQDVSALRSMSAKELRLLGRLPYPMIRRQSDRGFRRISWDEALTFIAERIRKIEPKRIAFYMTSRGITNEVYYVTQKVARFIGTNNVDNSARLCHAPSTTALKATVGYAASTCSYKDWIGSDLLVFFGSNVPNNQPVTTKYIYYAKKEGTQVAVVNPHAEPGLKDYWVPSVFESALFGTKIADNFFMINTGGDIAFINGVLKHLIENDWLNKDFIQNHTTGFEDLRLSLQKQSWDMLEGDSGASRDEMLKFAKIYAEAKTAIFVWSMGITQHRHGVENVKAIVNLALARGMTGREKCGLMPIRGHSGVQGGAEVGAVPMSFPGGVSVNEENARRFSELWHFSVPSWKGLSAADMIDAAYNQDLDLLYSMGGNFLETLPEPEYIREALEKLPLRIHQDIILSPQMLLEPAEAVVLLPGQTRYEQRGGGTETTTERRILFSPEIKGRRLGESKPEWEIPMLIAEHAYPEKSQLIHFKDADQIRQEIAKAVPFYDGIQRLKQAGDQVQWGGPRLGDGWKFPESPPLNGKARFTVVEPPNVGATHASSLRERTFLLTTRRGKQFNSMIHNEIDPLTGARRDDVLISQEDAERLGLKNGDPILLKNEVGEYRGYCKIAPIKPKNLQVYWPEGNVLIRRGNREPESGIPDYNAVVEVIPLK